MTQQLLHATRILLVAAIALLLTHGGVQLHGATLRVLSEEIVTRFVGANNGAGPLWCYGSSIIVRDDSGVYVSVIETGEGIPPLCNTRWQVWKRTTDGWQVVRQEEDYRQREPCPLVTLGKRGLLISANPSTTPRGTHYLACRPTVFSIVGGESLAVHRELPVWSGITNFNDHSYRGFAADSERGEALLLNIDTRTSEQFVSQRGPDGNWHARGKIKFPIRAAYPQVGLRNRGAHVMAIGDIREPNAEWAKLKAEVLKREWDYVFRRLFYTYSPDIHNREFVAPIEIDSVDATAGHILNLDMHVDPHGDVHLLYLKQPHQYAFIRDKYFPGEKLNRHLEYVVMRQGEVVRRATLASTPVGSVGVDPSFARFHIATGERIYAVIAGQKHIAGQPADAVNIVQGIVPPTAAEEIRFEHPFGRFFTSSPRFGCQPSDVIDFFGTANDAPNLRYAAVQLPSNL